MILHKNSQKIKKKPYTTNALASFTIEHNKTIITHEKIKIFAKSLKKIQKLIAQDIYLFQKTLIIQLLNEYSLAQIKDVYEIITYSMNALDIYGFIDSYHPNP